jgi:L-fuculose-phosphate aldolase
MLLIIDQDNTVLSGTRKVFSEIRLHRAAYEARPDIGCVILATPPTAVGFAAANVPFGPAFMAKQVVSLGQEIPLLPFYPPKDDRLDDAIKDALQESDVLMLANNGVLAVGGSFEQAFLRMEMVEHIARILLVANQLGGPKHLDASLVRKLSQKGRPASSPNHCADWKPQSSRKNTENGHTRNDINNIVSDALKKFQ